MPTNAGLLFFGRHPQWRLMQSEVVCVLFRETVGVSRSADRKIVTGTIQDLINGAEAFLNRYIAIGARVEGFKRIDLLEYSLEVLPEAAINAVVHRNYSKRGESIRVFYYPDRVEVHSPGMLLPGITVEQMEQGIVRSRLRNSVLAGLLRDVPGYMERVGSGIRYMLAETKRLRLPSPQFKEMDEFIVTFARASGLAVSRSQQQPRYNRTLWNEPLQLESSVQEVSDKLEHRLTQVVVYVQGYGFITNALYRELTGVSERTAVRDLETHRSLQFQAVFENYPLKRLILSM